MSKILKIAGAIILTTTITIAGIAYTGAERSQNIKTEVDSLISKINTLNNNVNILDEIIKEKNLMLEQLDGQAGESGTEVAELEAQITTLTTEKAELQAQITQLNTQASELTNELQEGNNVLQQAQEEITRLESELTKANNDIEQLESYVNNKVTSVAEVGNEVVDPSVYDLVLTNTLNVYLAENFSVTVTSNMSGKDQFYYVVNDNMVWANLVKNIRENISPTNNLSELKLAKVEASVSGDGYVEYTLYVNKEVANTSTKTTAIYTYLTSNPKGIEGVKTLLKNNKYSDAITIYEVKSM